MRKWFAVNNSMLCEEKQIYTECGKSSAEEHSKAWYQPKICERFDPRVLNIIWVVDHFHLTADVTRFSI